MRSLSRLSMLVCVVAAMSFVALSPAQARPKKHEGSHHPKAKHKEHKEHAGEHKKHKEKKGAHCKDLQECRGKVGAVIEDLKAARKAVENGHSAQASEKLSAAIEQLEHFQKQMAKMSAEASGKPVNTTCPIMGSKVDPENTPRKLTRTFKGKTVGFCCAGCPPQWDKLSDEEKAEKLKKVMDKE